MTTATKTTDTASQIRDALSGTFGTTRRQISVRKETASMCRSFFVTIRDARYSLAAVNVVAERFASDHTYIHVDYSPEAAAEVAAAYLDAVEAAMGAAKVTTDSSLTPIGTTGLWLAFTRGDWCIWSRQRELSLHRSCTTIELAGAIARVKDRILTEAIRRTAEAQKTLPDGDTWMTNELVKQSAPFIRLVTGDDVLCEIENPCQAELGSKPCENPANVRAQEGGTVEIDACDECAHALHEDGCAWEDGCAFCSEADLPTRPARSLHLGDVADVLREILEHDGSRIAPEVRRKAWAILRGGE